MNGQKKERKREHADVQTEKGGKNINIWNHQLCLLPFYFMKIIKKKNYKTLVKKKNFSSFEKPHILNIFS